MISHPDTPSPEPGLPGSLHPMPGEVFSGGPSPLPHERHQRLQRTPVAPQPWSSTRPLYGKATGRATPRAFWPWDPPGWPPPPPPNFTPDAASLNQNA